MIGVMVPVVFASDTYRPTGWGNWENDFSSFEDWNEGESITVRLVDNDMNKDPNSIEKFFFPTSSDYTIEGPLVDGFGNPLCVTGSSPEMPDVCEYWKKVGGMPHVDHFWPWSLEQNIGLSTQGAKLNDISLNQK